MTANKKSTLKEILMVLLLIFVFFIIGSLEYLRSFDGTNNYQGTRYFILRLLISFTLCLLLFISAYSTLHAYRIYFEKVKYFIVLFALIVYFTQSVVSYSHYYTINFSFDKERLYFCFLTNLVAIPIWCIALWGNYKIRSKGQKNS